MEIEIEELEREMRKMENEPKEQEQQEQELKEPKQQELKQQELNNKKGFTEHKDIEPLILYQLDDRSLLSVCLSSKYLNSFCNKEDFWMNRFLRKYGKDVSIYTPEKPQGKSWKNHYMQIIIDLDRYKQNPMNFFRNIYWNAKGINYSFYKEDEGRGKLIHFSEAPEWVKTNFWLLDLGNDIKIFQVNEFLDYETYNFSHPTPNEILSTLPTGIMLDNENDYISGFRKNGYGYLPVSKRYR